MANPGAFGLVVPRFRVGIAIELRLLGRATSRLRVGEAVRLVLHGERVAPMPAQQEGRARLERVEPLVPPMHRPAALAPKTAVRVAEAVQKIAMQPVFLQEKPEVIVLFREARTLRSVAPA